MSSWKIIKDSGDVKKAVNASESNPVIIFKHSTSCPISSIAKLRIEDKWSDLSQADWYYLDLIKYRSVSNQIAADLKVHHESPQAIVLHKGEVIYDVSHMDISVADISSSIPAS